MTRGPTSVRSVPRTTARAEHVALIVPGFASICGLSALSPMSRAVDVSAHQRDGTQLHHVTVDGLAEWIAWWDTQEVITQRRALEAQAGAVHTGGNEHIEFVT